MSLRPLQLAAGAAIGALIGGAAVYHIGPEPVQRAVSSVTSRVTSGWRDLTRGDAAAPERGDKSAPHDVAQPVQAKALRDEQARQLRTEQQRASGGAGSEALEAAARKERAWNRFYKKPAQCDGNPSSDVMTECANHYIRAKRQFEEAYATGKL